MTADLLWPPYGSPADLAAIESVSLAHRGLPASTYAILTRAASLWPDRPAVTVLPDGARWQHGSTRTFAELLGDVHQVANLLHANGIRRGDAVALVAANCDELLTATLAAELAGIAAPVNPGLSPDHAAGLVRRCGARVLITSAPGADDATRALGAHLVAEGLIDTVLLLKPTGGTGPTADAPSVDGATVTYLTAGAAAYDRARFDGTPPAADDIAALFHTGGTTGAPKLAAHTHANQVANAWMVAASSALAQDSVIFAALPLFHVNALIVTTLAPLLRGQRVVWAGPLGYRDPDLYANFWKVVSRYGIATMSAVPTVYAVLAKCPVDADISSMRQAIVGASGLPDAVRDEFESHTGITLVEGYGLTEATCASARSFPDDRRVGTVGQRLPYQRVKAVRIDDAGGWHDVARGQVGTLAISGPTVFAGYVVGRATDGRLTLSTEGTLVDGWLNTGDLAWIDEDDFIHLTGRAKDLIIRGGHNIDPATVEDALLTHPDVTGAAAVGAPDAHAGEVPVAYVTLAPGAATTAEQLCTWAAERVTERAAAPKAVTVLDALPVTAIGKPHKLPLRAHAARQVVATALAGHSGVTVDARVDDGTAAITVTLADPADHNEVHRALGRYSITYRISGEHCHDEGYESSVASLHSREEHHGSQQH
ncbi:MAG: acyl-CoA synthetase [Mycobacterium sp.]